uniref:Uncharacterized protein n=1 Tax=Strombidium inclinatum TaxID=197538 RepID=A0A7S3IP84_9SPIT
MVLLLEEVDADRLSVHRQQQLLLDLQVVVRAVLKPVVVLVILALEVKLVQEAPGIEALLFRIWCLLCSLFLRRWLKSLLGLRESPFVEVRHFNLGGGQAGQRLEVLGLAEALEVQSRCDC